MAVAVDSFLAYLLPMPISNGLKSLQNILAAPARLPNLLVLNYNQTIINVVDEYIQGGDDFRLWLSEIQAASFYDRWDIDSDDNWHPIDQFGDRLS